MKIIKNEVMNIEPLALPPAYIFAGMDYAVLDIETLGLSPAKSQCILCGIVKKEDGKLMSYQFFAEDIKYYIEEEEMLEALETHLQDVDVLVTYNGRSFDVPFVEKRREILCMPASKPRFNLDIYTVLRDHSDLKSFLPNLKQTTVENYAGLWDLRTDTIDGKESISMYYDYLLTKSRDSMDKVLLHNADDIAQLYRLIKVLNKADMDAALYANGFPTKCDDALYLVNEIKLKEKILSCHGLQALPGLDYSFYGDEKPSLNIRNGTLDISVPLINHENVVLVDLEGVDLPLLEGRTKEDYLVLSLDDDVNYGNCNLLIKAILHKYLED